MWKPAAPTVAFAYLWIMTDDASLTVRPVETSDARILTAAAWASRDILSPWATPPIDGQTFARWMAAHATARSCVRIALRGDGVMVGCITLSEIVRGGFQSAYLAYWGNGVAGGRGLMTRAVGRVIAEAFGPLGLHRLEANIQPENVRSIALMRRLVFVREGYSERYLQIGGAWRDHERWAIRSDMMRDTGMGA